MVNSVIWFSRFSWDSKLPRRRSLRARMPFGSAVEAYDTAAIVHLTEYAE
jgi:hypothetical protein